MATSPQPNPPPPTGNRLAGQTSPYLRQHAAQPVHWQPWDDEALGCARRADRPIFLSIGYAACHWCHVMAHESFDDADIARRLNDAFVCIKVDREERPDIDEIYMTAAQMLTGGGGWPLSLFLTPDLEPFFAGTYFPPDDRQGYPGFRRLVAAVAETWRTRRGELVASGRRSMEAVRRQLGAAAPSATGALPVDGHLANAALQHLRTLFDAVRGGFSPAPKFPPHAALRFLLAAATPAGPREILPLLCRTLDEMAAGGVADQVGGGFHRYAVDDTWTVPHFEKMLYDNAQLAAAYTGAWQLTGNPLYRHVAERTLDYLLRDQQSAAGPFHASQDADSPGGEGAFYTWDAAELAVALPPADAVFARTVFDLRPGGHHAGRQVLRLRTTHRDLARAQGMPLPAFLARLDRVAATLRAARARRPAPATDDKLITGWNALAISALAIASRAFGRPDYDHAAQRAATFLLQTARLADGGTLAHSFAGGRAGTTAFLDDTAGLALATFDLYETTGNRTWLQAGADLVEDLLRRFGTADGTGLYSSAAAHADAGLRPAVHADGVTPSGGALAVLACLRGARLLGRPAWQERAQAALQPMAPLLARAPGAFLHWHHAAAWLLGEPVDVRIAAAPDAPDTEPFLAVLFRAHLPQRTICWDPAATGAPAVHVCRGRVCLAPARTPAALAAALGWPAEGTGEEGRHIS